MNSFATFSIFNFNFNNLLLKMATKKHKIRKSRRRKQSTKKGRKKKYNIKSKRQKNKMITRSMTKKRKQKTPQKRKYSMRIRQVNMNSNKVWLESNKKRLRVEIYSGFIMQLIGDQMVSSYGGDSRLIKMLNAKYNKQVSAACSDKQTYLDLRQNLDKRQFRDQVISHNFGGETCSHFVYYDENGIRHDSYSSCRQREGGNQFCQNHALFMAYNPEYRYRLNQNDPMQNIVNALEDLYTFWNDNLIDILNITSQEDFARNIANLRQTNLGEQGNTVLFEYGEGIIEGIETMIYTKNFEILKYSILNSLFQDNETVQIMANW